MTGINRTKNGKIKRRLLSWAALMMCAVLALLAAPVLPVAAAGPAVVYGAEKKIAEEVPVERIFDGAGLFDAKEIGRASCRERV